MIFTIEHLINSIGSVLKSEYPDIPVYADPHQQGTSVPCFFISLMQSYIHGEVGNSRNLRELWIDIAYLQERNITNRTLQFLDVIEFMDTSLSLIPYSDGESTAFIRTGERSWNIEDQDLHYKFAIRQRVCMPQDRTLMELLEENNVKVK